MRSQVRRVRIRDARVRAAAARAVVALRAVWEVLALFAIGEDGVLAWAAVVPRSVHAAVSATAISFLGIQWDCDWMVVIGASFGGWAVSGRPLALRTHLAAGVPLSG
jgi:hypothetical protein